MDYIKKITKYKNVVMQHKTDERRTFLKKELLKIDFESGNSMLLIIKPKKYQNVFDGSVFRLINSFRTKEKILFENEEIL